MIRASLFILEIISFVNNAWGTPPKRSNYPTSKEIEKCIVAHPIEKTLIDSAINIRVNPLCINGVLSFDEGRDSLGNEIFKLELTLQPFLRNRHHVSDIASFTIVDNCFIYITETKSTSKYTSKQENKNGMYFNKRISDNALGFDLDLNGTIPIETFYFVITNDTIKRYYPL